MRELSSRHKVKGYDGELDDDTIRDFANKIDKMSRDQNQVLERLKVKFHVAIE